MTSVSQSPENSERLSRVSANRPDGASGVPPRATAPPTAASDGASDPCERRWQCRPHDQVCIVPGTSAPRSTSSRSVTVTALPFDFTSHQNATASSSVQALLSSRSRPVHHTSRKRRASVSLGHSARSGRSASDSAIHSSSVHRPRAPGVAPLRREAIETDYGAGGKSADLGFEAAARTLVMCRVHGIRTKNRTAGTGWRSGSSTILPAPYVPQRDGLRGECDGFAPRERVGVGDERGPGSVMATTAACAVNGNSTSSSRSVNGAPASFSARWKLPICTPQWRIGVLWKVSNPAEARSAIRGTTREHAGVVVPRLLPDVFPRFLWKWWKYSLLGDRRVCCYPIWRRRSARLAERFVSCSSAWSVLGHSRDAM